MRPLHPLLLCFGFMMGCVKDEPTSALDIKTAIPSQVPAVTIEKKKIVKDGERTVYEVTHTQLPELPESERLRNYEDLKHYLRALAEMDSGMHAYDAPKLTFLPADAKNAWRMAIGPPNIAEDGIVRIDLWPTERYPALVTFAKPMSDEKNRWYGTVGDMVLKLNPKRHRGSSAIYRVDEKRFLLFLTP